MSKISSSTSDSTYRGENVASQAMAAGGTGRPGLGALAVENGGSVAAGEGEMAEGFEVDPNVDGEGGRSNQSA